MTPEKNNSIHQEILTPEHSINLVHEQQQQQLERWSMVKEEEELSNFPSGWKAKKIDVNLRDKRWEEQKF